MIFYLFRSDLYEGMRTAGVTDLHGIKQLLLPLEESGTLIKRTEEEVYTRDVTLYFVNFFLCVIFCKFDYHFL